jgi:hypothetical protein
LFSAQLQAQLSEDARDVIEKYLENIETDGDFTQIIEDIEAYLDKPISINTASAEELMNFPLISPSEAASIVQHRITFGYFLRIDELQVIGLQPEHIRALSFFINTALPLSETLRGLGKRMQHGKLEIISTNKHKQPLDLPDSILGNLLQQSVRIRYTMPGHYSMGITAEKDAGERYWNKGPDFYSAHVFIQNIGKIQAFAAGDFLLSFGQGLVMGSGIGTGKSALVMNIKRNAPNLKPYRGVNEFLYLRGAATTLKFRKNEFTIAAARNGIDARISQDTSLFSDGFSSADLDGYHRNTTELENKNNAQRNLAGVWYQRRSNNGYFGGGITHFQYNIPLQQFGDLYRKFYPFGNTQTFYHTFQAHTLGRFHLFSEWAYQAESQRKAGIAGVLASLGKGAEASLLWRNFESGFVSPYNTAFGNTFQNEQGLYAGIKLKITPRISWSHYTDLYKYPWLTFRLWAPSRGKDILNQIDIIPRKKVQFYVRFRYQDKPLPALENTTIKRVEMMQAYQLRVHANAPLEKGYQLQMRIEKNRSIREGITLNGSMAFIQLSKTIGKSKFTLRYTAFDIADYYNRIFAFENQLAYDFGTVAFYGKGTAAYVLYTQKLNRHFKVGLRAHTQSSFNPGSRDRIQKQGIYLQLIYSDNL